MNTLAGFRRALDTQADGDAILSVYRQHFTRESDAPYGDDFAVFFQIVTLQNLARVGSLEQADGVIRDATHSLVSCDVPDLALALGLLLYDLERIAEAELAFLRVTCIATPAEHVVLLTALFSRARSLQKLGRLAEAEVVLLEIAATPVPEDHDGARTTVKALVALAASCTDDWEKGVFLRQAQRTGRMAGLKRSEQHDLSMLLRASTA